MRYLYNEDSSKRELTEITKKQKEVEQLSKEIDSLYPKIENLCKKVDKTLDCFDLSQILFQIQNAKKTVKDYIKMYEHDKLIIKQELEAKGK